MPPALHVLALVLVSALPVRPAGTSGFGFPSTIGGAISDWVLKAGKELEVWSHNVSTAGGLQHGAYLDHFWSAGGKGPLGTYAADRQIVRYYIDGEAVPAIEFEPAMACGSGIGYERLGYYQAGHNMKERECGASFCRTPSPAADPPPGSQRGAPRCPIQ